MHPKGWLMHCGDMMETLTPRPKVARSLKVSVRLIPLRSGTVPGNGIGAGICHLLKNQSCFTSSTKVCQSQKRGAMDNHMPKKARLGSAPTSTWIRWPFSARALPRSSRVLKSSRF